MYITLLYYSRQNVAMRSCSQIAVQHLPHVWGQPPGPGHDSVTAALVLFSSNGAQSTSEGRVRSSSTGEPGRCINSIPCQPNLILKVSFLRYESITLIRKLDILRQINGLCLTWRREASDRLGGCIATWHAAVCPETLLTELCG